MNSIEIIIEPRKAAISTSLDVRRILPFRDHRMVGPFCFLDHIGPSSLEPNSDTDVRPHPHIGLSTVTYLFDGSITHRDSLGCVQDINPGDVNWMTAGRGIVHSERISQEQKNNRSRLHGLQAWIALPLASEQTEPSFKHHPKATLPHFTIENVDFTLIAGSAFGYTAPAKTHSPLFYLNVNMVQDSQFNFNPGEQESAFYILHGQIEVDGQVFQDSQMVVFKRGAAVNVRALTKTHGMLLGGAPLEGPRHIFWNFVASNKELIEAAKVRWLEQSFEKIEGETEFTPLPKN